MAGRYDHYEYGGQTIYFCAPGCKRAFEKDPEHYLGQGEATSDGG